jgi:hypothetical protein
MQLLSSPAFSGLRIADPGKELGETDLQAQMAAPWQNPTGNDESTSIRSADANAESQNSTCARTVFLAVC